MGNAHNTHNIVTNNEFFSMGTEMVINNSFSMGNLHDGIDDGGIDDDSDYTKPNKLYNFMTKKTDSFDDKLLKFINLKFNEKIINPHIEAKLLSSKYIGSIIKSIVYETVYNTILYTIFINSIDNDPFLEVDNSILHKIRKDLITFASILANNNVEKLLEIKEYRAIKFRCQKRKCVECHLCNNANNKIRNYDEQISKYKENRNTLIIKMKSNEDFRKAILNRDGNFKKIIEAYTLYEEVKEIDRLEKIRIEQLRQEQIAQERIRREQLEREQREKELIRQELIYEERRRIQQLDLDQLQQEQLHRVQKWQAQIIGDEKIRESRLEKSGASELEDDDKRSCSICMGDFVRPTAIKICGHVYCYNCIILVCDLENKRCPLCKEKFIKSDLMKLFF